MKDHSSLTWQMDANGDLRGACRDAPERDKAQFTSSFPLRVEARNLAHRYCHKCPILADCYAWATEERYFSGVAGGAIFSSAKERAGNRQVVLIPRKE